MNVKNDKAMALAGLLQCGHLVSGIARSGLVAEDSMSGSLASIFVTNPDETIDVYQNGTGVRTGLRLLIEILDDGNYAEHSETIRYSHTLIKLEKRLRSKREILHRVGAGIRDIQEHQTLNGLTANSEEILERLSSLYEHTLSAVEPRIRVLGLQKHLRNEKNTNRIRSLLLAGLRSAVLWRQLGGTLPGLILGRRSIVDSAHKVSKIIN